MFPIIIEDKNRKSDLELFLDDEKILNIEDNEIESKKGFFSNIPTCAKVGLGLLGLFAVG